MFRRDLAQMILEIEVVKFGAFRLKLHETQPDAPLPPIYLSFRKPPKGPLTDGAVRQLADALEGLASTRHLKYDCVVGVPEAGEPFAEAFTKDAKVPLLFLDKEEADGKRQVVAGKRFKESMMKSNISAGARVLLIDDLVTQAHSKLEAAEALRSAGLVVNDVLVLVDREQGGLEELAKAGLTLHAVWGLSRLLDFYLESGLIQPSTHHETVAYLDKQR